MNHPQNLGKFSLLPTDVELLARIETPDARGAIFPAHPDFLARAERHMRESEEDVSETFPVETRETEGESDWDRNQ